jgi:hypothetical protein
MLQLMCRTSPKRIGRGKRRRAQRIRRQQYLKPSMKKRWNAAPTER